MAWYTHLNSDFPMIELSFSGIVTPQELSDAAVDVLSKAQAHGVTRVLTDCAELQGGHTTADLCDLGDSLARHESVHTFKEAVIMDCQFSPISIVEFWETVCVNRGFNSRIFKNRSNAIAWLLE